MVKLSASLMCSNLLEISKEIKKLEKSSIDMIHIDVMDGHFVKKMCFGQELIDALYKTTKIPFEIHLMIENPGAFLETTKLRKGDTVIQHIEICNKEEFLTNKEQIKNNQGKVGLAINLETPIKSIKPYILETDEILLMAHKTGVSGLTIEKKKFLKN